VNPVLNYTLQEVVNRTALSGKNKVYKTNTKLQHISCKQIRLKIVNFEYFDKQNTSKTDPRMKLKTDSISGLFTVP
jgi:hypothetical protein